MFSEPQAEHRWLDALLGHWEFTHECQMGPGEAPSKTTGKAVGRTMGGLWLLLDCSGDTPPMGPWTSQFTLGFDPFKGRFVGSFIASMMTYLWTYDGQLDADGKRLVLDADGPRMDGQGMAKYQDLFEIVSPDHWLLRSQMLGDDGQWQQFMQGHHRRIEAPAEVTP